jgi:hypothetical protein
MTGRLAWPALVLPLAAAAAAAWSLVPFAAWWIGADLGFFTRTWTAWGWGTTVVIGLAVVLLILTRGQVALALLWLWRRGLGAVPTRVFVPAAGAVLAVLSLLVCWLVFAGNPRNVDGFAQLFQARIFLAGHLSAQPPAEIASFATLHMILGPARWLSQYPPGQPLVLAAGLAGGAWWLLSPVFAALLAAATYRVARWTADEATARLALVLLCLSPFVVAVSGSEMSHLPAAALGLLACAAATGLSGRRWRLAGLAAGGALGVMIAFRPLDAVAAAVPVAAIALLASPRPVLALGLIGVSAALTSVPTLWYNAQTTGAWTEFGYRYLWGPEHALGFHPVPWGVPLTLPRAVSLIGLDLHQLNTYLFDLPFPVLLLAAIGMLAGRRRLEERDAVPLLGAGALVGLLFFYWHRDVFYGPRLLFSAVPWVVIMVARAVVLLRRSGPEWRPGITAGLAALTAVATAFAVGLVAIAPDRLAAYRAATPVFSLHPDRDARRAGIGHAVVVIPDGWGSRLIARMWALGVPVRRSARLYAGIDACTLQLALDAAEDASTPPALLLDRLDSLLLRRRPGVRSGATEDPNLRLPSPLGRPSPTATLGVIPSQNLRLLPDSALAPACRAELGFDQRGFLAFSPFLYLNNASLNGDIVWARDLGAGNAPLFRRYRGRRFYRYAPEVPGGRPVLTPLEAPTANGLP